MSTPIDPAEWEPVMREALAESSKAEDTGEVPVGALLLDQKGTILSRSHNQCITLSDPTAHAEVLALRAGARARNNYRLTGTTLVVTLEPCLMCLGAMVHARIERLVFGAFDPKTGVISSRLQGAELEWLNHRIEVLPGILADECSAVLRRFFRSKRTLSTD